MLTEQVTDLVWKKVPVIRSQYGAFPPNPRIPGKIPKFGAASNSGKSTTKYRDCSGLYFRKKAVYGLFLPKWAVLQR